LYGVFDKFGLICDNLVTHIARLQDVILDRFQPFGDSIGHKNGIGIRCSVDGGFDAFPAVDTRNDFPFLVSPEHVCNTAQSDLDIAPFFDDDIFYFFDGFELIDGADQKLTVLLL